MRSKSWSQSAQGLWELSRVLASGEIPEHFSHLQLQLHCLKWIVVTTVEPRMSVWKRNHIQDHADLGTDNRVARAWSKMGTRWKGAMRGKRGAYVIISTIKMN